MSSDPETQSLIYQGAAHASSAQAYASVGMLGASSAAHGASAAAYNAAAQRDLGRAADAFSSLDPKSRDNLIAFCCISGSLGIGIYLLVQAIQLSQQAALGTNMGTAGDTVFAVLAYITATFCLLCGLGCGGATVHECCCKNGCSR